MSDGDSPFNGTVIPDLNGGNRFLRGNATSGGVGGSETHTHSIEYHTHADPGVGSHTAGAAAITGSNSTLPSYYEIVWIMRIK